MMETTMKAKGGTITLPKTLRKSWNGAQLFMRVSRDMLVVKKIQPSSFWNTWKSLRVTEKTITQKDITNAVVWGKKHTRS